MEYRQQLNMNGAGRRRRLASLFGSSSRKQWKPAQTLNGRPYVVGHVPHSPSYREVEFEGLLRSNESATKIISLKVPERSQSLKSSILSPLSTITSPLQTRPALQLAPVAENPIERTSSRTSTNSSANGRSATPVQGSQNPHRRSIFRLPVSPTSGRTVGLPPSEYDTVDFHTRLASIEIDEPDTPASPKSRRGKSRDDAWVDILVGNNSRRLGAQDAELRNGNSSRAGRSDPDLASQELSEVLASVRGQIVSDDEDDSVMEPVHGTLENGDYGDNSTVHTVETDGASIPEGSMVSSIDDNEPQQDEDDTVSMPVKSKRLGYFDLHPDRRPPARTQTQFIEDVKPSPQTQLPQLRTEPAIADPRPSYESDASKYDEPEPSDAAGPSHVTFPMPPPLRPSPEPRSYSPGQNGLRPLPSLPKGPAAPVPPAPAPAPAAAASPAPSPQASTSKTASLIELYRERERSAQAVPVPASKLPVRTGSMPGSGLGLGIADRGRTLGAPAPAPAQAPPPVPRESSPSPSAASVDSIDESLSQTLAHPRPLGHADVGLISTLPRYIHGAPLHNVLEEEEEEVEE